MKILVINGPNLNMLGIREPDIYGKNTFSDLLKLLEDTGRELGIDVEQYQSNHEGDLVDEIQGAYNNFDGIINNLPPVENSEMRSGNPAEGKETERKSVLEQLYVQSQQNTQTQVTQSQASLNIQQSGQAEKEL